MARYGQAFKDRAAARFDAVLTTASLDEAGKSAWCREHGVYPQTLAEWRQAATQALAEPEESRASPQQTKQDRRRSRSSNVSCATRTKPWPRRPPCWSSQKKVAAIFNRDEDE